MTPVPFPLVLTWGEMGAPLREKERERVGEGDGRAGPRVKRALLV